MIRRAVRFVHNRGMVEVEARQVRFPLSKKRRIRNKWRWQSKNWRYTAWPLPYLFHFGDTFIGHPETIAKARRAVQSFGLSA